MRKIYRLRAMFVGLLIMILNSVPALTMAGGQAPPLTAPAGLVVTQLKTTGDEFVVIENNTGAAIDELSNYWLYAFNKTAPSEPGASSSGQQLPVGSLGQGETLLLSDKARPTCGAAIAGSLSPSLGDSNGYLQIIKQVTVAGTLTQLSGDSVSWGSDATVIGTIPKMPTNTSDPAAVYYRTTATTNGWQLADLNSANGCELDAILGSGSTLSSQPVFVLSAAAIEPPATIVSLSASDTAAADSPVLPASDQGLSAPVVNELLPNPAGTGNDATDEFIELYNPNAAAFDLSGFVLQTGLTTKHKFTFPADTLLAPKSFKAFYSADTGLNLSNTGGMAALLDPFGNTLGQSAAYGTAKDGEAWALAKGTWYWTSSPTPGAANVIKQVASTKSKTKTSQTGGTKKSTAAGSAGNAADSGMASDAVASVTPIHPWTLAVIAAVAVAYGVYEYRLDLANRFYRLRSYRANRRANRQSA